MVYLLVRKGVVLVPSPPPPVDSKVTVIVMICLKFMIFTVISNYRYIHYLLVMAMMAVVTAPSGPHSQSTVVGVDVTGEHKTLTSSEAVMVTFH